MKHLILNVGLSIPIVDRNGVIRRIAIERIKTPSGDHQEAIIVCKDLGDVGTAIYRGGHRDFARARAEEGSDWVSDEPAWPPVAAPQPPATGEGQPQKENVMDNTMSFARPMRSSDIDSPDVRPTMNNGPLPALDMHLQELEQGLVELEKRLQSVLRPSPPVAQPPTCASGATGVMSSNHGMILQRMCADLARMNAFVRELRDRVEV